MGGGGKGGNTTTSNFKPPEAFMKAYKESLGMARDAANQPYEQYKGQLVAGLTPTQQQGIANVNAAQGMALPAIQQGMDYTQQAAKGITPGLYNKFYSPYVKDVANTTFANLMESQAQQQSNLKSGAIQAGAFGGDRGGVAQAEMARQQQLGNAMAMSNIYNQGYGQAMGLAGQQVANLSAQGQQMAALGAGAQGSVLQGAQAQMAAGAQEQATKQAELQAAYDQWMQHQAYPYQQAQFFANIAQGLGAGAGGTSSTTTPPPNLFSQVLGGIGAIGSIYGASDKRVKENIQPVGKLNDGQTVYRYNFKGDPKTQIGLLAQEVEHTKPGAVAQVHGLKMVDYKGATDDAAQMSSMGGVVAPGMDRQGLAGGGVPYYPYEDARTYVPEGKIGGRGSTIPSAPEPFNDKGLAEDWNTISPISSEQAAGLRAMAEDVGLDLPAKEKSIDASGGLVGYANGGTAARKLFADGGMEDVPEEDAEGLAAVPAPEFEPPAGLVASESGGDFSARNPQGYVGRLQFGTDRLTDAKRAGVIPAEMTAEQFRRDPRAQKATEAWHFGDINDFIDKSGLAAVEGKTIKGIPVTRDGLVNVAHLGGKGGLQRFVSSGGKYDPSDANGTHLSDYLAMASKGGVAPVPAEPESSGLAAAAPSASSDADGYVIKGQKPGLKFDLGKLFASEDNPSLIEKIMGRRLSPEARSAVMNASFALMAGRSPYFATNLGEAGKVGTQTYYNALGQRVGMSEKQADIMKKLAETSSIKQTLRQKLLSLYYMSKTTFDQDPANDDKAFMPFDEWAAKNGFPDVGGTSPASAAIQPPAPPTISSGTPTQPGGGGQPPAAGAPEVSEGAKEGAYKVQPEGSPTVLASASDGPSPANKGTLPYWQDRIKRLQAARATADYISPEYAASLDKQIELARNFSNDILNSDQYKEYANFTANYEKSRADLEKLANINARFKGGRGSEQWADFIGALQTAGLDWAIPDSWQSNPGDYDQVMKAATEMAVRNSASLGGLSKAPGSLMELETKFTPDANLSPSARYSIIRSALADLAYKNDVFSTWDMGPNFAQHQKDFNRSNKYANYLKFADETLPQPAVYEGEITPGSSGAGKSDQQIDPEIIGMAVEQLNEKFPDANSGSMKYLKVGDKQLKFVKTTDGWVAAQ